MKRLFTMAFSMIFVVLMANAQGALKKVYSEEKVLRFFKNWTPKAVKE